MDFLCCLNKQIVLKHSEPLIGTKSLCIPSQIVLFLESIGMGWDLLSLELKSPYQHEVMEKISWGQSQET